MAQIQYDCYPTPDVEAARQCRLVADVIFSLGNSTPSKDIGLPDFLVTGIIVLAIAAAATALVAEIIGRRNLIMRANTVFLLSVIIIMGDWLVKGIVGDERILSLDLSTTWGQAALIIFGAAVASSWLRIKELVKAEETKLAHAPNP